MNKVFIAIPNLGWIQTQLALTVPRWLRDHQDSILYAPQNLKPIAYARNYCVDVFLKSGASHLLMIDADIAPAPDTLSRLLAAGVPVIAAKVHQLKRDDDGQLKPCPMLMRRDKEGNFRAAYDKGVQKIDRAGFACMLYSRVVFEKIKCPWFDQRPWGAIRGTDFIFCEKMEEAGIPLYGHFDVECQQYIQCYI